MSNPVNQMFGNQFILTTKDIRQWQEDIQKAERAKADADAIIADRRRKLDAAAIFGVKLNPIPLAPEDGGESLHAAVERILGGFDRAVAHHELQAELRKIPRFAGMLDKHKGAYYYTVIARLKKDDKIRKVGKKIRLIHKNETPPEHSAEGVS